MTKLLTKVFKIFFVNLAILLCLLFLTELVLQKLYPDFIYYERNYPGEDNWGDFKKATWSKPDSDLGWIMKEGRHQIVACGPSLQNNSYHMYHGINKEGFRNPSDFGRHSILSDKIRVLLLGDSCLFGVCLEDDQTISSLLQNKLGDNYEVYNLAIPGWGLDQMLLAYLKYVDVLQPQVVLLLYINDDIPRVYEAKRLSEGIKPVLSFKDGQLSLVHKGGPKPLERLFKNSQLVNRYIQAKKIIGSVYLAQNIFLELKKRTEEKKQQLMVFRLPDMWEYVPPGLNTFKNISEQVFTASREHFLSFADWFESKQIIHFDLFTEFHKIPGLKIRTLYLDEAHPTQKGAEVIAEIFYSSVLSKAERIATHTGQ